MRNRFNWNHNENQKFLNTLIHCFVFRVAEVKSNDFRTCKQLHDNGTGNDWSYTQVHDGSRSTCHNRTETTEQIQCLSRETIEHDVGHCKVDDENECCRPHFLIETNVSFRLGDGRIDIDEAAKSIETTAVISAPHETNENCRSTKSKQTDAHKEESYAFIIAAPSGWSDIPCCKTEHCKPAKQLTVSSNNRHCFETFRHVNHETGHQVTNIYNREDETKDGCFATNSIETCLQIIRNPIDEKSPIEKSRKGYCYWHWLMFHA